MNLYSIDRIECGIAVLVDEIGNSRSVPLGDLPANIQEGAMLRLVNGVYEIDADATQSRRARVLSLEEKLRHRKQ